MAAAARGVRAPPGLDRPVVSPPPPEPSSGYVERGASTAEDFMVVAAHPEAARVGYEVLAAGGSAVDAAIAVQMVLGLVEPQSSGLGGGGFLVHYDGSRVEVFDGRETAPAAAQPDLFLRKGQPLPFADAAVGGRAVGVPGIVRMLELAHQRHGRLPWRRLLTPAITLAEGGFSVSPRLAALLDSRAAEWLREDPVARAYFFQPDGTPKRAGTRLANPELGETLRELAKHGSAAFYDGPMADEIVRAVTGHPRNPGFLTRTDLAGYRPRERAPLCFAYRTFRVCGAPPPASGVLALGQILGFLANRHLAELRPVPRTFGLEPQPDAVHLLSEAERLAFADRGRYVADPDFVPLPGGSPCGLLHPAYLRRRGRLIGARSMGQALPGEPETCPGPWYDGKPLELPSTSHLSIVDADGNAVSMTSSIESGFGAKIMVRGFLLNNQLTDFAFAPGKPGAYVANRVEPGKRPLSSMAPLLVFQDTTGELFLNVGSPGGSAIINYLAKVLVAVLDWGLDIQTAISLPNFGSRNGPTELERDRVSPELMAALQARGHDLAIEPQTSGLHGIQRIERHGRKMWLGGADPRREGVALGQ